MDKETLLDINYTYPKSDKFDYEAKLSRINLDKERELDLVTDNGFIISEPQSVKKDLKSHDSIYSDRFGPTLEDTNAFGDRYKCSCGMTTSALYEGTICPNCGTEVKFVDDDFNKFGWIILKDGYHIMHSNLFKTVQAFIGEKVLDNIISDSEDRDENGNEIERVIDLSKEEPFEKIGMIAFYEHFDEIIEFYRKKNPNKIKYYNDIIKNRDKIFTQSIPVYTTHLRPFKLDGEDFTFEGTNGTFNMMARLAASINNDRKTIGKRSKPKKDMLYDLQTKYELLYEEMIKIISGKKGTIRSCLAGRYNFSARSVIIPDTRMKIDQVSLSYHALAELLQQRIVNILHKTYNMSYADAYQMWYAGQLKPNKRIKGIIESIIHADPRGLPIIINRNPSLSYGAILQVWVVDIQEGYTLGVCNNILLLLAGDYDGDTLNIHLIINNEFLDGAEKVFNPRNAMFISRNDGKFNSLVNHNKDLIINMNTLTRMTRKNYSPEQLAKIKAVKYI